MTIYCSKDLGFVSAKKYPGNPGKIISGNKSIISGTKR